MRRYRLLVDDLAVEAEAASPLRAAAKVSARLALAPGATLLVRSGDGWVSYRVGATPRAVRSTGRLPQRQGGRRKLSASDVRAIRKARGRASLGYVSERFGVSLPTLSLLTRGIG